MFFHPIWVHFDDTHSQLSAHLIHELQRQTQELLAKGELGNSCQLLLVCAALHKLINDYPAALANVQRAWTLAELYDLPQVARWAAWGTSALCVQQGDYQQATEHLNWLYVKLKESGDWVLANIVEVIGRTVSKEGKENSYIKIAYDWLARWGESPLNIEAGHMKSNSRHHRASNAADSSGFARRFKDPWWRSILNTLKRIGRGDLRLKWVEVDRSASPAPVSKSLFFRSTSRSLLQPSPAPPTSLGGYPSSDPNQPISKTGDSSPDPHQRVPIQVSAKRSQPSLVVYTLGPFRVYQNDRLIETWASRKALAVLKYLIAHHHIPVSKDVLMEIFWPDTDPEAARRNLHQAIYALRQTLKSNYFDFQHILFENECYRINPALDIWLDCEEFEKCVKAGQEHEHNHAIEMAMRQYGMAEGLYQDNFLCEDLYEDWPVARRQTLCQTYLFIALRLAQYYATRGEYSAAIAISRRILSVESTQEEAHQILIQCYLAQGLRHLALSQYQMCVQILRTELDLPPSAETESFYHKIAKA